MKARIWTVVLAVLLLGLAGLVAGCAKKEIASGPEAGQETEAGPGQAGSGTESGALITGEELPPEDGVYGEGLGDGDLAATGGLDGDLGDLTLADLDTRIHFAFDSYELSQKARDTLKDKARLLRANPDISLIIQGHCDDRGTEEYNLALGERRARAAYEFLVLLGISPQRLSIVSFGEEKPLVKGDNEAAWAQNRRAEFKRK
jgi:peptidoglycan-associated lipoprotein